MGEHSIEPASEAGRRPDKGAVAVEFALILPALLLLVVGIINFGWLLGQKLSLNQAVREGARMAVVPGTDNGASVDTTTKIQNLVRASTGGLVNTNNVTVAVKRQANGANIANGCATTGTNEMNVGDQLRVEATLNPTSVLILGFVPGLPNTFTSTAVYRCEF